MQMADTFCTSTRRVPLVGMIPGYDAFFLTKEFIPPPPTGASTAPGLLMTRAIPSMRRSLPNGRPRRHKCHLVYPPGVARATITSTSLGAAPRRLRFSPMNSSLRSLGASETLLTMKLYSIKNVRTTSRSLQPSKEEQNIFPQAQLAGPQRIPAPRRTAGRSKPSSPMGLSRTSR